MNQQRVEKMRPRSDAEAEELRQLEREIEKLADKMPAYLWDASGLADLYNEIDEALLSTRPVR